MPDVPTLPDAQKTPDLRGQAQQQIAGWLDVANLTKTGKWVLATAREVAADLIGLVLKGAAKFGAMLVGVLARAEDKAAPEFGELAAAAVSDLFGVANPGGGSMQRGNRGGRAGVATDIGDMLFKAFAGQAAASSGGELQPTDAPAKAFLSTMTQLALEGWLEGWIVEACSLGQIETFGDLDDIISHVLGLGRASAAVHGPLVRNLIVTPLEWKLNKDHRPTLLAVGDAIKAYNQGAFTRAQVDEELARQGYSAKRTQARIDLETPKLSAGDIRASLELGILGKATANSYLRNLGYPDILAEQVLTLWETQRQHDRADAIVNKAVGAYADRVIDRGQLRDIVATQVPDVDLQKEALAYGDIARLFNVRRLSLTQVETMVKSNVLNFRDYRAAAERDGYPLDDVTSLELQLRWEKNKEKAIEEHRAELDAERAAAKAARDAAAAERRKQIDAERALARRGSEADLERAAIHGKIPIARVEEVYGAHYDDDTVAILVDELETARQAYLDEQAARDAAKQRGARRNLDTGALDQAFMRGHLTAQELRGRLVALGFDAGDADLLVANAIDQKADADALAKKRAAADATAKKREIDLGRFERLVRKGARTMPQYVTLLESLDVDEAAIPDFVAALQVLIDEDAAARAEREKAAAAPAPAGLTLEQFRRAVVLGVKTLDQFSAYLIDARYTTDAQEVLIAELRADLDDAELARRRRATPPPGSATPGTTLATIRRAAQLGIISPDAYLDRLRALGYSEDDVDLELELLLTEIADLQEARRRREVEPPAGAPAGLSLAELERAVKAGVSTIEDYRARAVALGKSPDEIAVLAAVVEREVQTLSAARAAHDNLGLRLAAAGDDLKALDAGVKDGSLTIVDYLAELTARGVAADEAQLVAAYVAFTIGG